MSRNRKAARAERRDSTSNGYPSDRNAGAAHSNANVNTGICSNVYANPFRGTNKGH
jgi:hypothetical protein